jgi:hypothetical protein
MTDVQGNVIGPASEDARDRRGHRVIVILVTLALLCFLVLGAAFVSRNATLTAQLNDQASAVTQQHQAAQALSDQVRELGAVPTTVAPPVTGIAGPQGATGPQGIPGQQGQPGKDGQSPPCLSQPGQCQGANGKDGANGAPGTPGVNGVDGKDGAPGQPGKDGTNGVNGTNGQPPASWTWTDPAGRKQQCTRDAGSPDSAPTYTCTTAQTGVPLLRGKVN